MARHHRTLARLDQMVSEAEGLCAKARDACGKPALRAALAPEVGISWAFRTILDRQVRAWMARAEATLDAVKPTGHPICGQRARELRHLVDIANAAILTRTDHRASWNAFYCSTLLTRHLLCGMNDA